VAPKNVAAYRATVRYASSARKFPEGQWCRLKGPFAGTRYPVHASRLIVVPGSRVTRV
jgi:hypothetical protein